MTNTFRDIQREHSKLVETETKNNFRDLLTKKLMDSYEIKHREEKDVEIRTPKWKPDSVMITPELENQWQTEIPFLIETVPPLMLFFIERWTQGRGFGPIEVVRYDPKIGLERKDYLVTSGNVEQRKTREVAEHFLFRPTALGLIDKIGKKTLGHLPLLQDFDGIFTHPRIGYASIIEDSIKDVYKSVIEDGIRNNYHEALNTVNKWNVGGSKGLLSCLEGQNPDRWLNYLDSFVGVRDIDFTNSTSLFGENDLMRLSDDKGNWTFREWMKKYNLNMVFPASVDISPEDLEKRRSQIELIRKDVSVLE